MPHLPRPSACYERRAFTVVELLIVVGIIGVLAGLTLFVGKSVMGNSKQRITQDLLRTLDAALTDYIANSKDQPPGPAFKHRNGNADQWFPMADAVNPDVMNPATGLPTQINSIGMFLAEARKVPSTARILDSIPAKYLRMHDIDDTAGPQPALMTAFDGWDRPIHYVHPLFQGVTGAPTPTTDFGAPPPQANGSPNVWIITNIRRTNALTTPATEASKPDGDGGMCVGNRPYFYSAGEDGFVGVQKDALTPAGKVLTDYNKDNVYSMPPNLP